MWKGEILISFPMSTTLRSLSHSKDTICFDGVINKLKLPGNPVFDTKRTRICNEKFKADEPHV